jgi:hypothetical protein
MDFLDACVDLEGENYTRGMDDGKKAATFVETGETISGFRTGFHLSFELSFMRNMALNVIETLELTINNSDEMINGLNISPIATEPWGSESPENTPTLAPQTTRNVAQNRVTHNGTISAHRRRDLERSRQLLMRIDAVPHGRNDKSFDYRGELTALRTLYRSINASALPPIGERPSQASTTDW